MDARELKDHLREIARNQGTQALTQDEQDYVDGRITFQVYQNRCYAAYCKGKLTKKRPAKH